MFVYLRISMQRVIWFWNIHVQNMLYGWKSKKVDQTKRYREKLYMIFLGANKPLQITLTVPAWSCSFERDDLYKSLLAFRPSVRLIWYDISLQGPPVIIVHPSSSFPAQYWASIVCQRVTLAIDNLKLFADLLLAITGCRSRWSRGVVDYIKTSGTDVPYQTIV